MLSNNEVKNLQLYLNRLRKWVFENEMVINPEKREAVYFTKVRVTESLNYSLGDTVIPKA
jgi:hypothetical protein